MNVCSYLVFFQLLCPRNLVAFHLPLLSTGSFFCGWFAYVHVCEFLYFQLLGAVYCKQNRVFLDFFLFSFSASTMLPSTENVGCHFTCIIPLDHTSLAIITRLCALYVIAGHLCLKFELFSCALAGLERFCHHSLCAKRDGYLCACVCSLAST